MTTTPLLDEVDAGRDAAPIAAPSGAAPHHRAHWWVLIIACLAQLMVVLDATIVNIALPTAQADIGFSNDNRQWIVTGYALAFGSLLFVGGRLGDLVSRKTMMLVGLVGFAGFSALGGTATTFGVLVTARVGQGVFGAILAPTALALITTTFTEARERGRAFAVYGALSGAGGAIGLVLGGALTEYASWRWCLYVNIPIAVLALLGVLFLLPRGARDDGARERGIDLPGAVLSVAGLVALVYGLGTAESDGWTSATTLGFIGAGLLLLVGFVVVERRVAHPLLPLGVVPDRNRGGSFLAIGLSAIGMFGVFLFLTYFMSTVLGFKPFPTGLAFLPMIGGLMVSAQTAPMVVARLGTKIPVIVGFSIAALGMLWFTRLDLTSSYASGVLPGLIVVGLGLGFVFPPAMSGATDRVDPHHAGVASAGVNTFQQIGGSIGTAVLSALASSAATSYLVGRDATDPLVQAQAGMESYTRVFLASAIVFAAGAVVAGLLLRHGALDRDPAAEAVVAH